MFDPTKFEPAHQVAGILTGTLDHPQPGGGQSCRVAHVDTGSGFRFTVALDRGGDIVQATHNATNLAFLTPNGYKPPAHAHHRGEEWLTGWPGGRVTTCGPRYIGPPRTEDGHDVSLHGSFSNTPAAVQAIKPPDFRAGGDAAMHLDLVIRETRMYDPTLEVCRRIACTAGQPAVTITDRVTNLGNTAVAHHWLYHVNLGYPLLDEAAELVYAGAVTLWQPEGWVPTADDLATLKRVPAPLDEHRGPASRVVFADVPADSDGRCHVGLINDARGLAVELSFDKAQLPRFANWQHYGPGCYVTGLEPFAGSLRGKADDDHPGAERYLEPGDARDYGLTLRVLTEADAIAALRGHDGALTV